MKQKYLMLFIFSLLLFHIIESEILGKNTLLLENSPFSNSKYYSQIHNSYLQVKEEDTMAEKSTLSSFAEMLSTQQANSKKKRYTEDGRLCAKAFSQNGQTYFDCTSTRSPDGQNKNKEWCYVDTSQRGDKPWDYCKSIMDYDKLREENQNLLKQFTIPARKLQTEIEEQIGPGQQAINELKKVRLGQAELDSKLNTLFVEIATLNNHIQSLYNTKEQWEAEEIKAVEIASKIELRKEKKKEEESKSKPIEVDKTEETIKREMSLTKTTIAPFIQERRMSSTYNCEGMLGYEEDLKGDGLMGQYYDNESFLGEYIERKDKNIDFDWTGASPINGINPSNFSVRWEGFIYAPKSSNYQFSIECDDSAVITINNKIIVSHEMFYANEESKSRVDKWLKTIVQKNKNSTNNVNKSISIPIRLTGGSKFKIVVSYLHSVHNDPQEDSRSFIKLYWQSDEFEERIITSNYLYTQNSYSPLKLTGFNQDFAVIRKLLENDLAFKNSDQYIIQDIPLEFKGSTTLKLNIKFLEDKLSFESNIPVVVYLARVAHYPNPIPTDFENTGEFMSLLEIQKPTNSYSKNIVSKNSALLKIYKKKFDAGKIEITLDKKSINVKGIPLIVFFGFDSQNLSPISCGGDLLWISNPNSKYYKSCTESSFYGSNWKCENGLNGRNKDIEGSIWASKREGIGAWLSVEFKNVFLINKIVAMNRRNPVERNSIIVALFSNGKVYEMKMNNCNDLQEFNIEPPIMANSVKFTINSVYDTMNNGGSFKIFGTKCIDTDDVDNFQKKEAKGLELIAGVNPKSLPPFFNIKNDKAIVLNCKDSLSNTKKLDHVKQKPGNTAIVRCQENCAISRSVIYGDLKYSKDSAICKAAYHSQKLKDDGGLVQIVFSTGEMNYKGTTRNGIKSHSKWKSDITLTFESYEELEEIILKNGSKVDIFSKGNWLPAVITTIKDLEHGKLLKLYIEGSEPVQKLIEISYPNKSKIKPCGDKVNNRDCMASRKNPNTNKPIKIRFVPNSFNSPGDYLFDKGETFGKGGRAYGWSEDMSGRIRVRYGVNRPELETFVEFHPSPNSKFCNTQIAEILCNKVTWSIKTGHGKFNVKLYVGDPIANTRLDLKVNDIFIVQGKTINKGILEIFDGIFDSVNEFISISSECINDCEYQMSKLNMVEISPYNEESKDDDSQPEQEDPCGNAYKGGRCDKGPDVTHCIYDDLTSKGIEFCTGNLMMLLVSKEYKCKSQRDTFKCVMRKYKDQTECLKFCPGKCDNSNCT